MALYFVFIILGAGICLWSLPWLMMFKLLMSIPLMVIAYQIYQHYWLSSGILKLTEIRIRSPDSQQMIWECVNNQQQKTHVTCDPRAYLSPSWLCVRLIPEQELISKKVKSSLKSPYLMLHSAQVSPNDWRDLHISIRYFSNKKQLDKLEAV